MYSSGSSKVDRSSINGEFLDPKFCMHYTVKPVLRGHSKRNPKIGFQYQLSLKNKGQKYCRMLQKEHSAIFFSTFIKLPFVFKTFVLSIFEWLLNTGFTLLDSIIRLSHLLTTYPV